jgi:tetratricopeptide (TPR) repeat protein
VLSRSFLVASLAECGAFTEGRALAEAGVQIAEAADHPYSRGSAYWGVGFLSLHQGDLHQAMPMLEHALNLAQGAHIWLGIFRSAAPLGAAYALAGRTADALPLLEQAVEQTMAMGFMLDHALRVTWLSEAYLLAGRLDDACTQAQCALEFSQAHQERSHTAYALRLLGEIAAHRDPLESALAEDHYQQALVLANELGMRPLQAHCHRGLGTLYSRVGRLEEARTALSTAIHMYRTMEMSLWLPQAEATLAQIGGRSQR